MIKMFKCKCINKLSYDKTEFIVDEFYFAYVIDSRITVLVSDNNRKGFCDIEKCMFKHGHPYGFQKYFEIIDTFYVENKKQIKTLFNKNIKE